ncbi:hypothetical protein IW140_005255 [Coemansia sp. RSA 1813]|nr:hypothetical protein EV178_004279 [Coemansia sp. RSA 1646]KAJ1770850.1 hypothetical protein LPJ74_002836 [Coemansia sp. RSA 1843]KAJ2087100.1 hypothetical protein IW138_005198 [Coemansia sp. RSA 986]KAJ2211734.1 hypothetical protein EV179_005235 [Coemansia sp. RSA 487]KAJ2565619.1 hypothetical protein IW140_005255 [Coemansia sp. RSA 1813]
MDSFASTVNPQLVYLDGLDARCSIIRVAICYWYENSAKVPWDEFMPPEILELAFYKTLQEFPILCGYIKADSSSRMYIEVDKNDLNMPVYTDACCNTSYTDLKESGFNIHSLPVDLSEEYGVPAPPGLVGGRIKQAYFRIIRFKDASGVLVFASIAHCLVDGYGYTQFMNRWAEISRWMQQPHDINTEARQPQCQYFHDRSIHTSYHINQTSALDTFTLESLSTGNAFTRWLTWISPETRGRVFKAISGVTNRTCCYFHIPSKTMEVLRISVQKHAPQDTRYSMNDIITAYVTIVIAQAKEEASSTWWSKPLPSAIRTILRSDLGKSTGFLTSIAVNIRSRINYPNVRNYMGSMVFGKSIMLPKDLVHVEPSDKTISTLAFRINQAISGTDEQYIGQLGYLLNSEPDNFMRQTLCYAKHRNKLIISSQARFAHYSVDFGAGMPALVRHAPHAFADIAYVMPANPTTGGYEIEFNLAPDVATNVIRNSNWMKLVEKYDSHL